jgi:hypothetical protein
MRLGLGLTRCLLDVLGFTWNASVLVGAAVEQWPKQVTIVLLEAAAEAAITRRNTSIILLVLILTR